MNRITLSSREFTSDRNARAQTMQGKPVPQAWAVDICKKMDLTVRTEVGMVRGYFVRCDVWETYEGSGEYYLVGFYDASYNDLNRGVRRCATFVYSCRNGMMEFEKQFPIREYPPPVKLLEMLLQSALRVAELILRASIDLLVALLKALGSGIAFLIRRWAAGPSLTPPHRGSVKPIKRKRRRRK